MASPLHGTCCCSAQLLSSRTCARFSLLFNNKIKVDGLCDARLHRTPRCRCVTSMVASSAMANSSGANWWEKDGGPNMMDVHSATELTDAIASAGDKLVIVEFYATWCGSCRALYPKLCRIAAEHADMLFLKVNFDENKPLCKSLNIKVLPYFHFYRGAEGLLDAFSCSISKLQKLKDAIAVYSLGPPAGLETMESSGRNTPDEAAPTGMSI